VKEGVLFWGQKAWILTQILPLTYCDCEDHWIILVCGRIRVDNQQTFWSTLEVRILSNNISLNQVKIQPDNANRCH
jgi:hypothetical protein